MSFPDIKKSVDSRAAALLEYHMSLLGESAAGFVQGSMSYSRERSDSGSSIKIGYDEKNKFMSKTYDLAFTLRIPEVELGDSFKARLKFRGMKQIDTGFFEIKPGNETADGLLNDAALVEEIVKCSRSVDLAVVSAEYSSGSRTLNVKAVPYAGAFMWVKLPPVYYPLKLNSGEMRALLGLMGGVERCLMRKLS
ncbi:MAG: hypothetical protein LBG50_04030 [Clostridiales Family XIII bacterium]|jgi:hypothetical protein|nr:hypothetical protein [Clostridiales Family XIII bacterium]